MAVNFYDVVAKDGQTADERFAGLTKDGEAFYLVGDNIYLGDQQLNNAAAIADAVTNIAKNAGDITTINNTLTKLENTEATSGSIRYIIRQYLDALDSTATLVSKSEDIVSFYPQVAQVNGTIAPAGTQISLAKVASTGAAEDVSYNATTSGLTATNVQSAIDEIAVQSAGGVGSKTLWVEDVSSSQDDYAKVYKLYQCATQAEESTTTLRATINIPKDKVLKASKIVNITFDATESKLFDGETDVTTLIKGEDTPTANDAGKYLRMEMQNVTDPLYVNLQTFVDVYSVAAGATEVQLALTDHEFSASIVTVDGSKVIYKTETSAGAGDGETVKQALTRLDGADSVTGSVSKKIKDAIEALDTSSDVGIASKSGDIITLKAGIKQEDGVIAQGTGSDIALSAVASTGASADVSYVNGSIATVAGALDDVYDKIAAIDVSGDVDAAIAELDGTAGIASKSGDVITLKAGVSEVDGVISNNSGTDIVLASIAATGGASDASVVDSGNYFTGDNVESVLQEVGLQLTWQEV